MITTDLECALGATAAPRMASTIESPLGILADAISLEVGPDKLMKFMRRFITLCEVGNPKSPPASPAMPFSRPVETGVDPDLLASLQKPKLGG